MSACGFGDRYGRAWARRQKDSGLYASRRYTSRGGALSLMLLLVTLVIVALLSVRALHSNPATAIPADGGANCEMRMTALVNATHGVGPDYERGYSELPPPCRALLPSPARLNAPVSPNQTDAAEAGQQMNDSSADGDHAHEP